MQATPDIYQEINEGLDNRDHALVSQLKGKLHVKACGRTFGVNPSSGSTLLELQAEVQNVLQMEGQDFHFFDGSGKPLSTDMSLREAIEKGLTPLGASLSDASIHYIENRREELAHMQWKLMREKMHGCVAEVKEVSQKVDEFSSRMDSQKSEAKAANTQLMEELLQTIEHERAAREASLHQVTERVNALALLIGGEQNKREFNMQNVEQQMQDLRTVIDNDRSTRHTERESLEALMQESKLEFECQKRHQANFETHHTADVEMLRSEIGTASRYMNELLKDQIESVKKGLDDVGYKVRLHENHMGSKLKDAETSAYGANKRVAELEALFSNMEERMKEVAASQGSRFDSLQQRQEEALTALESMRIEEKLQQRQIASSIERLKDLEKSLSRTEEELKHAMEKETEARAEELIRVQTLSRSDQVKQLAELEEKVISRLALETTLRERGTKNIFEEMGKHLDKAQEHAELNAAAAISTATAVAMSSRGAQERHIPRAVMPMQRTTAPSNLSSPTNQLSPSASIRPASPAKMGSSLSVPSFCMGNSSQPPSTTSASTAASTKAGGSPANKVEPGSGQPRQTSSGTAPGTSAATVSTAPWATQGACNVAGAAALPASMMPGPQRKLSCGVTGGGNVSNVTPRMPYRQGALVANPNAPPPRQGVPIFQVPSSRTPPDAASPAMSRSHSVASTGVGGVHEQK